MLDSGFFSSLLYSIVSGVGDGIYALGRGDVGEFLEVALFYGFYGGFSF